MMRVLALLLISALSMAASAEAPDGYPFLPFDQAMQQAQEKHPLGVVGYEGHPA